MGELQSLINIGPQLEKQLQEIGISTIDQLKDMGSKKAWLLIKALDPSA